MRKIGRDRPFDVRSGRGYKLHISNCVLEIVYVRGQLPAVVEIGMSNERIETTWPTEADIDQIIAGADRVVVLIMPRDVGKSPDAPRGQSSVIARADVAAEWQDGAFHVFKRWDLPAGDVYLVWSNEHRRWWGPFHNGYVQRLSEAGRYSLSEALAICRQALGTAGHLGTFAEIPVRERDVQEFIKDSMIPGELV